MSLLTTIILTILAMIFVLGPLVALHEWGHYIIARMCGVKVLTYSIGFGKKLWSWTSPKTGIEYQLAALPLGGFVRMLDGREGDIPEGEEHLAFDRQHPLKKIAIVFAGPAINLLIAMALFWVLFMTPTLQENTRIGSVLPETSAQVAGMQAGDQIVAIDDTPVVSWEEVSYRLADRMGESGEISVTVTPYQNDVASDTTKTYNLDISEFMQGEAKGKTALSALGVTRWLPSDNPKVGQLVEGSIAAKQGMKLGDEIVKLNGEPINNWLVLIQTIGNNANHPLDFTVLREGQEVDLQITPEAKKDDAGMVVGRIGVGFETEQQLPESYKSLVSYEPIPAIGKSVQKTINLSKMTVTSMGKMLVGMIGLENLSGPITIARVIKRSFEINWQVVLNTAALISLSLAVLNLLPIPVLDGGHILFYFIELIRGKPLSDKTQIIGFNIGFMVMACFMLLAIGLDISRLF